MKLQKFTLLFFLLTLSIFYNHPKNVFAQSDLIQVQPVSVSPGQEFSFMRSIYSSKLEFIDTDTLLWDELENFIQLETIRRENKNTLVFTCNVLPGLNELGKRYFQIKSKSSFLINDDVLSNLKSEGLPFNILATLESLKNQLCVGERNFENILHTKIEETAVRQYRSLIFKHAKKPQNKTTKAMGFIEFRAPRPEIHSVHILSKNTLQDTLQLFKDSNTSVDIVVKGQGFYKDSRIIFDDPAITVTSSPTSSNSDITQLIAHLEIDKNRPPEIGPQKFRISHPFAMTNFDGVLNIKSAERPFIINFNPDELRADGSVQSITIKGMNFSRNARVVLPQLTGANTAPMIFKDRTELQFHVRVPITRNNVNYQVIVTNPDGQSTRGTILASRRFAIASPAIKNRAQRLYFGKPTTMEFIIFPEKDAQRRKFSRGSKYEVKIGSSSFPAEYVNQVTLRALIDLPTGQTLSSDTENLKLSFSVGEKSKVAEWTGEVDAYFPPTIKNPPKLILHPGERLTIILNGNQLAKASLITDENIVISEIKSTQNQLVASITAGNAIMDGNYEIMLSKDGLSFETIPIRVKQWVNFDNYIRWGKGRFPRLRKLTYAEQEIYSRGVFQLELDGSKIAEAEGKQIVSIEARLDSLNSVPFFTRSDTIVPGKPAEYLPISLSGQIQPGNVLRLSISNINHQNEYSLRLKTVSKWHERVEAATGVTAMRIPMNGDNVQLLGDIALGLNYRFDDRLTWAKMNVSAYIMNPNTDDGFNADIGAGVSMVLWNHMILGLGKQFTANSYNHSTSDEAVITESRDDDKPWFLILGVTFKFNPAAVTK